MKTYDHYINTVGEVGFVRSVMNSMVYASGLPKARVMELVVSETGQQGIVQSLLPDAVEILMLEGRPVRHGTAVARTNEILTIPVGDQLLGRSVDPFVNPIDGKKPFYPFSEFREFEAPAPPIYRRDKIDEQFITGVNVVDLMVPLGKGQRELVIGDQRSGKTTFMLQAMKTQAKLGSICIFVGIGKKKSTIKRIEESFNDLEEQKNIVIIAADASSPASFIYLVPFTGMSIAEYFRDKGKDVFLVLDGLNTHAKLYREIALLSKKTPGREAYPGDIFYLHSHLLERAGKVLLENGKPAAITVLASIETVGGDFTGYIQTNAMSMTDGHIFFDLEAFQQGRRPAVSVPLSVSRVGRQTQTQLERDMSQIITTMLSDYLRAQNYARFGVELSGKTRDSIEMGEKLLEVFQQDPSISLPKFLQDVYTGLLLAGYWHDKPIHTIRVDKVVLLMAYNQGALKLLEQELATVADLEAYKKALQSKFSEITQLAAQVATQPAQ